MARKTLFLIFLVFLPLSIGALAAAGTGPGVAVGANASSVMIGIYAQVETNATTAAEYEEFLAKTSLIVLGSGMDLAERALLDTAKTQNPWLAGAQEADDSNATRAAILAGNHPLIILVGGPEQNAITRYGIGRGWFNETRSVEGGLIVKLGKLENGAVVVSISDRMGYEAGAVRMEGAKYSPLNAIMPKEYVPAAATGISIIALILINLAGAVIESKVEDYGKKGRKVGEGKLRFHGFNFTEIIAMVGASAVLGASISWQFFGPSVDFLLWVVINSAICFLTAILHELTHRIFAFFLKIRMEYQFWPAGSALTLISSYLGNAFSVQGFLIEEIPEGMAKWKIGLMKLAGPLVSAFFMVLFAAIYYIWPSPLWRAIYSISGLWAFAEMLPFGSFDGKDVREWNSLAWFVPFCLIAVTYAVVMFLI